MNSIAEYLEEIKQFPLLSASQEIELGKRILEGDEEAKQKLITSNLRLVVFLSKPYHDKGIELTDLIQQGNLGLIEAAGKYDYTQGTRFATYAGHYIKKYFTQILTDQSRLIRLPANVVADLQTIKTASAQLAQSSDEEPSLEELSKLTGMDSEYISRIMAANVTPASLNQTIDENGDTSLEDIVPDMNAWTGEEGEKSMAVHEGLMKILSTLPAREKDILIKRFGIDDGVQKSLEEVGQLIGITKERVRQLEIAALTKLRQPLRKQMIEDECIM
jgi:RNA polymerase primary sigma factor